MNRIKYFLSLCLLMFIGCGTHVTVDKIQAEGKIDHAIRFDFSNFESYFRIKCEDEIYEETGYEGTDKEIATCVNSKIAEFISLTR